MSEASPIWRVNRRPRISALELGEYVAADDSQRETKRRNLKYERIAPTLLYSKVHDAIAAYLASPSRDRGILTRCSELLEGERVRAMTPQQHENAVYALRSLERFVASLNALPVGGLQLEKAHPSNPYDIGSVRVSIRPTALVRAVRPRGPALRGALLIDPAKGIEPKSESLKQRATDAMSYTSMLLHEHVYNTAVGDGERASPAHCMTFHTHRQQLVPCPTSYKKQLAIIQAACRGMAAMWESIEPPASFDPSTAKYRD